MELFFVSPIRHDDKTLTPRVPKNFLTENGFEDNTTPRVCFSPKIDGCLIALSQNLEGKILYVHSPVEQPKRIKHPTEKQVPDVKHTGEVWVMEPVTIRAVKKIVVGTAKPKPLKYTYGGKYTAELYAWNYKEVPLEDTKLSEFSKK